jgi:isocitrate/isopropylmalate dehydrogenase
MGHTMHATLTLLPGDGIGPEVVAEGVRVLQAVERAVVETLNAGIVTGDVAAPKARAYTTAAVGEAIAARILG